MRLRWDRVLDRAWLGLAAAAAVTVAIHEGAAVGRRAWTLGSGGAALAAPAEGGRAVPPARAAACGPAPTPSP
ncbi:hypothetical protein LOK46_26735 [Methylobacterium sp. NMS14P]|uniref:hypothetical protein n=1 Tax=Methylobacterium sp. NMS14P TaxID=2894310 RepID=UPI002358AC28|nr:hypothetical protein [Methylobacterium sp. NMS14P]WCS24683.1 hypothetical protein LOK46_26735 [Methylobacterium sp. NMS14P]